MWVTWNDGTITLGRKTINVNHIASVIDPYGARQYTSLHISALDSNFPVQWEFDIDAGKLSTNKYLFVFAFEVNIHTPKEKTTRLKFNQKII